MMFISINQVPISLLVTAAAAAMSSRGHILTSPWAGGRQYHRRRSISSSRNNLHSCRDPRPRVEQRQGLPMGNSNLDGS